MNEKAFVKTVPGLQQSLGSINTAKTFTVAMAGFDTLILDVDFTRSSGTAIVFSFTGKSVNTTNDYGLTITNYAGGTISDGSFTYTTSSTVSKRFVFSLTGVGCVPRPNGDITVSVIATAGGAGDTMVVTPIAAVTG
jgi:hypothetical protein